MTSIDVPFLPYDIIRTKADNFLKLYNPTGIIPVPIEEIIEFKLKMDIVPIHGLQDAYDIDGWVSNDLKCINVDLRVFSSAEHRYRFTLAHELAHRYLHRKVYKNIKFRNIEEWIDFLESFDSDKYKWFEQHAYNFAGLILVPTKQLIPAIEESVAKLKQQGYSFQNINETLKNYMATYIAKRFNVSAGVVGRRLNKESSAIDEFFK